jgi:sigma-70-like protein
MASQLPDGHEPGLNHRPLQGNPHHLVASFLSQDEPERPLGVSPLTAAFLRAAIHTGAWRRLDDRSASLIAAYFATEATLASCGQASGTSNERVRQLIGSGLRTLWECLPAELQARYPWEAVPKSKDQRARHREALKARWHDPA